MGSWITYGLGSESDSLPSYVVMPDPMGAQPAGQPMYTQGYLPAVYQPTMFRPGDNPVLNLDLPEGVSLEGRKKTLDFINKLNESSMHEFDDEFAARINSYDLAFKMQTEAPESIGPLNRIAGDTRSLWHRRERDQRLRTPLPHGS
jgi:hypothetical protein